MKTQFYLLLLLALPHLAFGDDAAEAKALKEAYPWIYNEEQAFRYETVSIQEIHRYCSKREFEMSVWYEEYKKRFKAIEREPDPDKPTKPENGLLAGVPELIQLNVTFFINKRASEGWSVVGSSSDFFIFERVAKRETGAEQDGADQPAAAEDSNTKGSEKPKASMFFPTGSDWVHYDGSCPKTHYPIIIQGGALEGDGATFRAIFAEIPSKDFQHVALHGLRTAQYEKKVKELSDLGYVLIYHQQFTAQVGLTHQAVWVKMTAEANRGEQHSSEKRSADLPMLMARLKSGESLKALHRQFQMGSSTHADYLGPGPEVGGNPASVMTFFRDSKDRYYRLFDRTRIELIEKPAPWLRGVIDAAIPPPELKAD